MNTTANITPGTPVTIKGEFIRVYSDGDFLINIPLTSGSGDLCKEETYVHPSAVTIEDTPTTDFLRPPQVDDKNRRFRQGDIVRPYYIREAPQCYELRKMGEDYPSAIFFKHRLEDAFEAAKKACDHANDTFSQP